MSPGYHPGMSLLHTIILGSALATLTACEPAAPNVGPPTNLPLHEVAARAPGGRILCVHVTGDGGFGVTDKGITGDLAVHGIPTVVLNSLLYFLKERTPDQTTADVARILRYYLAAWHKDSVVLIGYSRGADVLPFVVTRLPPDLRGKVRLLVLVGMADDAEFELPITAWLFHRGPEYPVVPELEKLRGSRILSFYGTEDKDAVGPRMPDGLATVVPVESGHRIGSNFDGIVKRILGEAEEKP